jgi:hypothetical protein
LTRKYSIRWLVGPKTEPNTLQQEGRLRCKGSGLGKKGTDRRTTSAREYQAHREGCDFLPAKEIDDDDEEESEEREGIDNDECDSCSLIILIVDHFYIYN